MHVHMVGGHVVLHSVYIIVRVASFRMGVDGGGGMWELGLDGWAGCVLPSGGSEVAFGPCRLRFAGGSTGTTPPIAAGGPSCGEAGTVDQPLLVAGRGLQYHGVGLAPIWYCRCHSSVPRGIAWGPAPPH